MDKKFQIPTASEISPMLESSYATAKEYFSAVSGQFKDVKVVSDLSSDLESAPNKVSKEIGIAALTGAVVFAELRFYDSYVSSKTSALPASEDKPEKKYEEAEMVQQKSSGAYWDDYDGYDYEDDWYTSDDCRSVWEH